MRLLRSFNVSIPNKENQEFHSSKGHIPQFGTAGIANYSSKGLSDVLSLSLGHHVSIIQSVICIIMKCSACCLYLTHRNPLSARIVNTGKLCNKLRLIGYSLIQFPIIRALKAMRSRRPDNGSSQPTKKLRTLQKPKCPTKHCEL